jgi:Uma2 family endonuclease
MRAPVDETEPIGPTMWEDFREHELYDDRPCLIVEVRSRNERGEKLDAYRRTLPRQRRN